MTWGRRGALGWAGHGIREPATAGAHGRGRSGETFRLARVVVTIYIGEIPPFLRHQEPHGHHGSRPRSLPARVERRRGLRLQAQEGPERGDRPRDVGDEGRARVDARLPAAGPQALRAQADGAVVRRRRCRTSTSTTSSTTSSRPTGRSTTGTTCPTPSRTPTRSSGIPEAERKYLAGVTAQYESEVVFHRNREDLEAQGVLFCDMDTAVREYPEHRPQVVRQDHPAQRQQVRRARTRPCGRAARSSTCRRA